MEEMYFDTRNRKGQKHPNGKKYKPQGMHHYACYKCNIKYHKEHKTKRQKSKGDPKRRHKYFPSNYFSTIVN